MLFDLLTAIPFWLLLAFIFCIIKFRRNNKHRKIYKRWCIGLGIVNLFLLNIHFTAIFGAGPLRGVVTDRATGKPLEGVRVNAYWSTPSSAPIRVPYWSVLINSMQFNCNVTSHTMMTDAEGRFSAYEWYGAKVWHGCNYGKFHATAESYRLLYEGDSSPRDISMFSPARVELDVKSAW
jgi:hypothetical protein